MPEDPRIAYFGEVPLIGLPLDRVARELFLFIFQRENILEDVDLGDLTGQGAFTRRETSCEM